MLSTSSFHVGFVSVKFISVEKMVTCSQMICWDGADQVLNLCYCGTRPNLYNFTEIYFGQILPILCS
jgi:hypothetical protein